MQYKFTDISEDKFRINGYEMYKTFVSFKISDTQIAVLNIFDSKYILMPRINAANVEVDNTTYPDANALITALNPVIYSPRCCGESDTEQIEANTRNISDLIKDAQFLSNYFNNYYNINQVDELLQDIMFEKLQYDHGEIDGDFLLFKDDQENTLLTVNIKELKNQGTLLNFDEDTGELKLSSRYGETLSSVKVKAKETYYDTYLYVDEIQPLLRDFFSTEIFSLVKTTEDKFYFVVYKNPAVGTGARIFLNDLDLFADLATPDIEQNSYSAWEVDLRSPIKLVTNEKYTFNAWLVAGDFVIPEVDTPFIGSNGNWWIGDTDTGVKATYELSVAYDDEIIGLRDGGNYDFMIDEAYKPGSLKVYLNGLLLSKGYNTDFTELNAGQFRNGAKMNRIVTYKDKLIFEYIPA